MSTIFEELDATLLAKGPAAVIERLISELRDRREFHGLFYGILLKKRLELGLPPVQVRTVDDIPAEKQRPYEDAIREAARAAGHALLEAGDIGGAWPYFRMIHEPEPIVEAVETLHPPDEDTDAWQTLVGVAWNEGVQPKRGFDLILERFGTCSAVTTLGHGMPEDEEVRNYCIQALVRNLYEETSERVLAEIERREGAAVTKTPLAHMLRGRDWLFEEDSYHIDLSHLSAVVEYAMYLPPCHELDLAIELCEYGQKLSPRFQSPGDPPFEARHRDVGIYLKSIAGRDVDAGVAHFSEKAESADPETAGTLPAEVLVNLLARLGRHQEAVETYTRFLGQADPRRLTCPGLHELCARTGDFRPYAELALRQGNLVNYTAGLLHTATTRKSSP